MAVGQVVKVIFDGKDQTSKAIQSLKGNLNQADRAIGNIKSSLGGMTAALGAAAGAAGFGLMARNALQTADALGKTSRKLGVTASELFKFQTQANLAGISTDTANMALQRFVRRTAEAAQGTGEAKNALIELGVNAQQLQSLPLAERMKVLADAFAGVQNPADRLRLAFKLFDSEGASMVNMLEGGREPLEETERRMRELGLTVDDTALPAIEDFNDSLELMQRQVQVAMIDGLGDSIPVMQDVADKLAKLIKPMTQGLLKGLDYLLTNLDTIVKGLKAFFIVIAVAKILKFALALGQLAKALGLVKLAAIALKVALGPIALIITASASAAVYFADDLKKLGKRFGILEGETDDASDTTNEFTGSIEDLQEIVVTVERKDAPAFAKAIDKIADEEIDATLRTNEFRVALEKLREKAFKPQKDLEDYIAQVAILKKRFEDGETSSEEFRKEMAELAKQYTGVKDKTQELIDEQKQLEEVIKQMSQAGQEGTTIFAELKKRAAELKKELEEVSGATAGMTAEQKKLHEEATRVEREISEAEEALKEYDSMLKKGQITADQYRRVTADVKEELKELREEQLTPMQQAIKSAFDDTAVGKFLGKMEELNDSPVFGELLGKFGTDSTGIKGAINGCFSTTPVTNFGDAVKNLFTGSGSALGGFGGALNSLTSALGAFFSGATGKFSAFKTAVIQILQDIAAAAIASIGLKFLKNLIPGINTGGFIDGGGFAVGGKVAGPGGPKEDKILARLSAGEFVMNAASVSKFGVGFFDMLNKGKMPGFQQGGFVGFDPVSIAITSVLNAIFQKLFGGLFGGSDNKEMGAIRQGTNEFVTESFTEAIRQMVENFGFPPRLYKKTRREDTDDLRHVIVPTISGGLIPSGSDLDHHRKVRDGLNAVGSDFAEFIYNFLALRLLNLKFAPVDFNMDDLVAKLFNDAQAVSGNLTLNPRQFGGPLERGQPSLVGESGPELFIPNRGGSVSPIKGNSIDLQQSIDEMKDEIVALRRQLSRELSGRRPAGVR